MTQQTKEQLLIEQLQKQKRQLVKMNNDQSLHAKKMALKMRELQRKLQRIEHEKKMLEAQLKQMTERDYVKFNDA